MSDEQDMPEYLADMGGWERTEDRPMFYSRGPIWKSGKWYAWLQGRKVMLGTMRAAGFYDTWEEAFNTNHHGLKDAVIDALEAVDEYREALADFEAVMEGAPND